MKQGEIKLGKLKEPSSVKHRSIRLQSVLLKSLHNGRGLMLQCLGLQSLVQPIFLALLPLVSYLFFLTSHYPFFFLKCESRAERMKGQYVGRKDLGEESYNRDS